MKQFNIKTYYIWLFLRCDDSVNWRSCKWVVLVVHWSLVRVLNLFLLLSARESIVQWYITYACYCVLDVFCIDFSFKIEKYCNFKRCNNLWLECITQRPSNEYHVSCTRKRPHFERLILKFGCVMFIPPRELSLKINKRCYGGLLDLNVMWIHHDRPSPLAGRFSR